MARRGSTAPSKVLCERGCGQELDPRGQGVHYRMHDRKDERARQLEKKDKTNLELAETNGQGKFKGMTQEPSLAADLDIVVVPFMVGKEVVKVRYEAAFIRMLINEKLGKS